MLRAFSRPVKPMTASWWSPKFINAIHDPKPNRSSVRQRPEIMEIPVSEKKLKPLGIYGSRSEQDPHKGTLNVGGEPVIQVAIRMSLSKSGTAQIASENGYLEGENDYIYSVVVMTPGRKS